MASSAGLPESAGVNFKFTSPASGAFVLLDAPALSKYVCVQARRRMVTYMRDNYQSWVEFAEKYGSDEAHDLLFICGIHKTTRWAVAAFSGDEFANKECYVTGDFGRFANGGLTINFDANTMPQPDYRCGPWASRSDVAPSTPHRPNQCLFLHYYKMKRKSRFWWTSEQPMQAAGGPHQLPPGPDNPGMDDPMIAGTEDEVRLIDLPYGTHVVSYLPQRYDPVNILLHYILSVS